VAAVRFLEKAYRNSSVLSVALSNLGHTLIAQRRYVEALPLVEASLRIAPQHGALYRALANLYLYQQAYPDRALEIVGFALDHTPQPQSNFLLQGFQWTALKGNEAQAAALTGRDTRANAALELAFSQTDPTFVPGIASLHLNAGIVRQIQGDFVGARAHFECALQLDPHGAAGQDAERALRDLATTP
jgi:tetratricopeptide (TPR) repeat protein